jgi:excisionase family DNA binding protein
MATSPPPLRLVPPAADDLQLLTIAETCAILQCSRTTVWRRVQAGELEATGDGSLTRITLASIRAYQERHKRKAAGRAS